MKRRWIEVSTVGPDERVNLAIERDRVELVQIAQWPIELAFQNRPKITRLDQPVSELDADAIWPHDPKGLYPVDRMPHVAISYRSGSILPGGRPAWSRCHATRNSAW